MKLVFGLLGMGRALLTANCPNGKSLFEVSCDTTGFTVVINENCRSQKFGLVNFANGFLWGEQTVTTMVNPSGTGASDVKAGGVCANGGTAINVKPTKTKTDSESNTAYGWEVIPLNSCGIAGTEGTDSNGVNFYEYNLYWNAVQGAAITNMFQLGQTQLKCKFNPQYHQPGDSANTAATVAEDSNVPDPATQSIEIATNLALEVGKIVFDGSSIDESALASGAAYEITSTDLGQTPTVGGQTVTYQTATTAIVGDYMQLKLVDNSSGGFLTGLLSMSLTKCWASNAALPAQATAYADTSTGGAGEFVFFDNFCPKYPSWVSPNDQSVTNGYLKEIWKRTTSLKTVHFRQFAFLANQADYKTTNGKEMYFHCFVKICDKTSSEATCSTTTVTGAPVDCSGNAVYSGPSRRRRSLGF